MVAGLPLEASGAAFAHLLLEPVAERRRAESLTHITHESDDGGSESRAISLPCINRIDELFEARAGVALPERNAAVEKSAEGSCRIVVTSQYQEGRLPPLKRINLPPVHGRKLIFKPSLGLILGENDSNAGRHAVTQIDCASSFQCRASCQRPSPQMGTSACPSMREIQLLKGMSLTREPAPITGDARADVCSLTKTTLSLNGMMTVECDSTNPR